VSTKISVLLKVCFGGSRSPAAHLPPSVTQSTGSDRNGMKPD